MDRLSKNPDVNVEVVASKWNWQFVYSDSKGPDGKPITTVGADDYIPVLVLPAGKSVQFTETSPGRHPLVLGAGHPVQAGRDPRRGEQVRDQDQGQRRRRLSSADARRCAAPTTR